MNLFAARGSKAAVGALLAGLLIASTSCSSDSGSSDKSNGTVKLVINDFGNFGFKSLIAEYQQAHKNIQITERQREYNQHHQQLSQHLAAGTGAGDIEAIDEGFIVQFRSQPQNFVNLLDMGADKLKDRWLDWKWQQSLSGDGKVQIGLGTDVGGLGMCYRTDLFAKASLPTNRDEVSKLWPTWDAFIETGKRFEAAKTGSHFVDSATNMFNPILAQQPQGYYNEQDQLIIDTNPGVKLAWDTTVKMVQAGESAKLVTFQQPWTTGMQKGSFATLACPAWMVGYLKENAPKTAGKWDIASVPGGGGNWGGSFLAIPKQSKHQKEAYDLAAWLTAPEQQLRIFAETGNLPSQPKLYDDPKVKALKEPFVNNAPTGAIFTSSARSLRPQYLGTKNGPVRQAVENVLRLVEAGKISPDAGWQRAVADAKRAAGAGA